MFLNPWEYKFLCNAGYNCVKTLYHITDYCMLLTIWNYRRQWSVQLLRIYVKATWRHRWQIYRISKKTMSWDDVSVTKTLWNLNVQLNLPSLNLHYKYFKAILICTSIIIKYELPCCNQRGENVSYEKQVLGMYLALTSQGRASRKEKVSEEIVH